MELFLLEPDSSQSGNCYSLAGRREDVITSIQSVLKLIGGTCFPMSAHIKTQLSSCTSCRTQEYLLNTMWTRGSYNIRWGQMRQHQRKMSPSKAELPFTSGRGSLLQAMPTGIAGKAPSLGEDGTAAARRM